MQKWIGDGRFTRDPELRYLASGMAVCSFRLAVEGRAWRDKDNNLIRDTQFLDFESWGKSAEFIQGNFVKGDPIIIEGSIKIEEWDDKTTGEKRRKAVIRVTDSFFTLSKRSRDGAEAEVEEDPKEFKPAPKAKAKPKPATKKPRPPADDLDDLDLDSEVL